MIVLCKFTDIINGFTFGIEYTYYYLEYCLEFYNLILM